MPPVYAQPIDHMEIRGPDGSVRQIPISGTRMVVGRAPQCEIRIDFDLISRQHAEFIHDPFGRWWVRDLGSRNGVKINGIKLPEKEIGPGDVIRIGKFEVRLRPRPSVRFAEDLGTVAEALTADTDVALKTLDEDAVPSITAAHLTGLMDLGKTLAAAGDPDARRLALCQALVQPNFGGLAAMVLRAGASPDDLQVLCPPVFGPGGPKPYYVSRTLLRGLRAAKGPVLGSNAGATIDLLKLSLDKSVMPIAGIACPLSEELDEVLYVALPPEYASMEWLNLAALAATQWRNGEAVWRERVRAAQHQAIERELLEARRIQQRYLPIVAPISGCRWSLRVEPCQWVGGDYADLLTLPDGRVYAGVADVCGKGLHAAMTGASLHTLIRVLLPGVSSLKELVVRANDYLRQFLPDGSFITMSALLTNADRSTAEYFNAGHPAPFLIQRGDVSTLPDAENIPLGLSAEEPVIQQLPLSAQQVLLLYTDGCTDVLDSNGDRLSPELLQEMLSEIAAASPSATPDHCVAALFERLERHRGPCLPPDDRTLLALAFG